LTGYCSFEY